MNDAKRDEMTNAAAQAGTLIFIATVAAAIAVGLILSISKVFEIVF